MPRIPLSQIPNAPQIVQGPVLTNPNAIRVPDIQRSARSLIQPTMAQGSFDGPAKGLQSLGAGVGSLGASIEKVAPRVSAVLRHFAQAKEQAQDLISLTTQRERQVAERGAFREEVKGKSEGDWVPLWQKRGASMGEEVAALPLTPAARERALKDHERFMARSAIEINTQANASWIRRGKATIGASVQRQFEAGEYEGAFGALHRAQAVGLYSKQEVAAVTERLQGAARGRMADDFQAEQPFDMQAEMTEASRTGASALFPWMGRTEIEQRRASANLAAREKQRTVSGEIDAAILGGQIRDESQVRQMAVEGRLPEEEMVSLIQSLTPSPNDPANRAMRAKDRSSLTTSLENYDPELDVDDAGYYALKRTIRSTVPSEARATVLKNLDQRSERGRDFQSPLRGNLYAQLDRVTASNAEESAPARQAELWGRAQQLKDAFANYLQKNPEAKPREIEAESERLLLAGGIRASSARTIQRLRQGGVR